MFGRMMNNYYYGKSGKGDFRKDDMPETRWQLFTDTLRTRLSALCRLNMLYMLVWLPLIVVLMMHFTQALSSINAAMSLKESTDYASFAAQVQENGGELVIDEAQYEEMKAADLNLEDYLYSTLFRVLLLAIPCIAITGPFTMGLSYVTRNWARDEHAFIWTDFKDAVKANWKQGLVLSVITAVLPLLIFEGWYFYGSMARTQALMMVPQILVALIGLIWAISVTYMYPLAVSYELKMKDVIRNGLLLGVARLPFSVGIRLLHCVPAALAVLGALFWNPMLSALLLIGWYFIIGFGLSRFVTASYTNAVFDRYINPRVEGAKVNQGLREPEDEDDDEEDEEGNGEEE